MTPRQEALAAQASEPSAERPAAFAELGLDEAAIFDREAVFKAISDAVDKEATPATIRKLSVDVLKAAQADGRDKIAEAFARAPRSARATVRAYSLLTDCVVQTVFRVATTFLHKNPNPTEGERLTILAVGGYGRGEMAPYSDVDLLFLMPWKITPWAESLIESMLYILWDLHMKVGHASRSVKDCIRLGKEDYTIRTALLEHRFLTGDEALAQRKLDDWKGFSLICPDLSGDKDMKIKGNMHSMKASVAQMSVRKCNNTVRTA